MNFCRLEINVLTLIYYNNKMCSIGHKFSEKSYQQLKELAFNKFNKIWNGRSELCRRIQHNVKSCFSTNLLCTQLLFHRCSRFNFAEVRRRFGIIKSQAGFNLSPEFKIYIAKEFQHLKTEGQKQLGCQQNGNRQKSMLKSSIKPNSGVL